MVTSSNASRMPRELPTQKPYRPSLASIALLHIQEGHSGAGSKLYICNLPGIRTPIHITRDYITISENAFYNGNMPSPGSSLYSRLQIYDSSHYWRA